MKNIAFIFVALSIAGVANSSTETEAIGNRTCRLWLAHMGRKSDVSWTQIAAQQWLAGYLSGLATGTRVDVLKGIDMEVVYRKMDDFCRTNPLLSLRDGGDRIFDDLKNNHPAQ
jgi:hypothetical protein